MRDHIYGVNLSTKEEFHVVMEGDPELPAIYGNIVVWGDSRNRESDIYGCILPSSITQSAEKPTEDKPEEGENGRVCLGTFFVALLLIGGTAAHLKRK